MKAYAIGVALLLAAVCVVAAQNGAQPAKESDEELQKKIAEVQKQLDDLRKQQEPLIAEQKRRLSAKADADRLAALKAYAEEINRKEQETLRKRKEEAERKAKEGAEKKKHYAKVEIRGLLSKTPEAPVFNVDMAAQPAWKVMINDLHWELRFGDKKELVEAAGKLAGKPVVIKGAVVNVKTPIMRFPQIFPQPQPFPQPWPQPNPWPQPFPQQQLIHVETPIAISVESIREAKD